jgi:tRNA (guanine10-N2)-methyltransferase
LEDIISDLVQFAAQYLVPGGRLVYWLPTENETYDPKDIPTHPCLSIIANSEQRFGKWSRRLITMEKTVSFKDFQHVADLENLNIEDEQGSTGHYRFRFKYFNKFESATR